MDGALTLDAVLSLVARDELPWDRAWVADFGEFCDRFTLHDSFWVGVFLNVNESNEAVFLFEWDSHWLPEPLRSDKLVDSESTRDPYLFIRVTGVRTIKFHGFNQPISGRAVGGAVATHVKSLQRLQICDFADGEVDIRYVGRTEFLCVRRHDGMTIPLAAVKPRIDLPQHKENSGGTW